MSKRVTKPVKKQSDDGQREGEQPFVLAEFMPFQAAVFSNSLSRLIARAYSDQFSISIAEWRVLAMISQYEHVTAQQVVVETPLDKVAVSRAVTSLVARGYVFKQASQKDRRAQLLRLSATGSELAGEIQKISLSLETQVLAALSADEQRQFSYLLARLTEKVRTLSV